MNIIITKPLHEYLQTIVIDSIRFGSYMKGNSTASSDVDLLHVIKTHKTMVMSPIFTGHLLQYKEVIDGIEYDHVYATESQIINGLVNGESLIFHEMLRYNCFKKSMPYLSHYEDAFDCFKLYKTYLGYSSRDVTEAHKCYKDKTRAYKKLMFTKDSVDFLCSKVGYHNIYIEPDIVYLPYEDFNEKCILYSDYLKNFRTFISQSKDTKHIPYSIDMDTYNGILYELCDIELLDGNIWSGLMMEFYYKAGVQ